MKYLVDPQLVLDVLESNPTWTGRVSALLREYRCDELILAPSSYLALSPSFMGMRSMQDRFLENLGVKVTKNAPAKVMDAAYAAWSGYQKDHPEAQGGLSVFDSLYIGAYALLFDGILTRQGDLYRRYFVSLNIIEP